MRHDARLGLGRQGVLRGWRATINRIRRDIRDFPSVTETNRHRLYGTPLMRQHRRLLQKSKFR
jgi:hypothetical protein